MAKFSASQRLDKQTQQKLLLELCQALLLVKDIKEAAQLLSDLLGSQELEMIAKRLQVAKLLIEGLTYQEIAKKLNTSPNTIARINAWLHQAGEGYRLVIKRAGDKKMDFTLGQVSKIKGENYFSWSRIKRRYPVHFWPSLLLEQIVRSASQRQRKKLLVALDSLKKTNQKSALYKQLNRILKE